MATRPVIGISSNFGWNQDQTPREQSYVAAGYTDAVFLAGGLPLHLPVLTQHDDAVLDELLDRCDGIVLTGGFDIDPALYGQEPHPKNTPLHPRREAFEFALFRRADARRLPIFAICLGHQVANVTRGGRLIQHLSNDPAEAKVIHHIPGDANAFHTLEIAADSLLAKIVGPGPLEVTSRHHQAVDPAGLGEGLRATATAADGAVEASEDTDGRFLLTVQWHPEEFLDKPRQMALFKALVDRAAEERAAGERTTGERTAGERTTDRRERAAGAR